MGDAKVKLCTLQGMAASPNVLRVQCTQRNAAC